MTAVPDRDAFAAALQPEDAGLDSPGGWPGRALLGRGGRGLLPDLALERELRRLAALAADRALRRPSSVFRGRSPAPAALDAWLDQLGKVRPKRQGSKLRWLRTSASTSCSPPNGFPPQRRLSTPWNCKTGLVWPGWRPVCEWCVWRRLLASP